jgi:ketosteroid isomerase-like protein
MPADNVDVVQRALGHFVATGEPDWALLDEDIATRDHDILDAGEYDGHEGHRRWIADWTAPWSDFEIGPIVDLIDAGDEVAVVFRIRATGRASEVTVEREDAIVCRVHGGLITRLDYYNNRAQALAHLGLQP